MARVGRTLLSAAFDLDFELLTGSRYCKEKANSKAADKSDRPTQSTRYSERHFGHLYLRLPGQVP